MLKWGTDASAATAEQKQKQVFFKMFAFGP